ncbi:MAG: hypothetical protein V4595_13035 [Pseudomonadota bacterium]
MVDLLKATSAPTAVAANVPPKNAVVVIAVNPSGSIGRKTPTAMIPPIIPITPIAKLHHGSGSGFG